jgi:cytochrome c oxidase subunit 2
VDGSKSVGPTWKGTWGTTVDLGGEQVKVDETFVKTAIVDPNAQVRDGFGPSMPTYEGKLSDDDIAAVTEYMKSLSGGG